MLSYCGSCPDDWCLYKRRKLINTKGRQKSERIFQSWRDKGIPEYVGRGQEGV